MPDYHEPTVVSTESSLLDSQLNWSLHIYMPLVFLVLHSLVCVNTTSCLQCKEQSLVHSCDFTASIHRLYVAIQRSAVSREHFDCVFLSVNLLLHICLQKISSSIEYISLCSFMTALCSRQAEMRFKNVVFRLAACFVRPPGIDHYMRRALEPQLVLVTAA